jgi:hypothetical protein
MNATNSQHFSIIESSQSGVAHRATKHLQGLVKAHRVSRKRSHTRHSLKALSEQHRNYT